MKMALGPITLCSGLLACVPLPAAASADPIFKCVDARGVAAYGQTPCGESVTQAGRAFVPTVARAPQLGWTSQGGAAAGQQRAKESLSDAEAPRLTAGSVPDISGEDRARLRKLDSDIAALGTLNTDVKRQMAANLREMQSQIANGAPVPASPSRRQAAAARAAPASATESPGKARR